MVIKWMGRSGRGMVGWRSAKIIVRKTGWLELIMGCSKQSAHDTLVVK